MVISWLTPTSDDEGNDGGAIHTNINEYILFQLYDFRKNICKSKIVKVE